MQFIQPCSIVGLVMLACAHEAGAVAILDQKQESTNGGGYVWVDRQIAQIFKPAISGYVDRIDVYSDAWIGGNYTQQMAITPTVGGVPDVNTVLGLAIVPNVPGRFGTMPMRSQNIWLDAETSYALWFTSDDPSSADPGVGLGVSWGPDYYPRGVALKKDTGESWTPWMISGQTQPTTDVAFRTYVDPVPEPATPALILAGLSLELRRRRRSTVPTAD